MLVQARFLASGESGSTGAVSVVLVPARLLVDGGSLWLVDGATKTAALRKVELGARRGDDVEVTSGVNISDKLIDVGRERLQPGARLAVREE
jgi:hypothetical protein